MKRNFPGRPIGVEDNKGVYKLYAVVVFNVDGSFYSCEGSFLDKWAAKAAYKAVKRLFDDKIVKIVFDGFVKLSREDVLRLNDEI